MSVEEIETAVTHLPDKDLAQFRTWFEQHASQAWDRQIEKDADNGRLDVFYQRLQAENVGHVAVPLDEVLDHEKFS